jgi:hypothetical protein
MENFEKDIQKELRNEFNNIARGEFLSCHSHAKESDQQNRITLSLVFDGANLDFMKELIFHHLSQIDLKDLGACAVYQFDFFLPEHLKHNDDVKKIISDVLKRMNINISVKFFNGQDFLGGIFCDPIVLYVYKNVYYDFSITDLHPKNPRRRSEK